MVTNIARDKQIKLVGAVRLHRSIFNMQRGDRGTVEEYFALSLK